MSRITTVLQYPREGEQRTKAATVPPPAAASRRMKGLALWNDCYVPFCIFCPSVRGCSGALATDPTTRACFEAHSCLLLTPAGRVAVRSAAEVPLQLPSTRRYRLYVMLVRWMRGMFLEILIWSGLQMQQLDVALEAGRSMAGVGRDNLV
jgi:hypothetical protein